MITTKRHLGRLIRRSSNPRIARMVARLDRAWRLDGKREGRLENALAWRMGQLSGMDGSHNPNPGECHQIQILSAALLGQTSGWEKHYRVHGRDMI